ncbi:hypothetical protein [Alteriqipengyuania lutimaris]|uniref:hypothetical protein n=1 Tax=Alteriqipengyuania lutimaris TaxID=1538146 RepID=UPI0015F12DB3|nr:hypothetical protein [Alteriqipengyuania lutimaris]MBB3034243.1 hypothetical protein [Alteriqipengyuania lutimaris]
MIALLIASGVAIGAAQPASDASLHERFGEAAKCRVHTEMLPALFEGDEARVRTGRRIYRYWVGESDRLGSELDLEGDELSLRYLLIPITPDEALLRECSTIALDAMDGD